ncbi:MAG: peroxiredoxin [Fervidicoccaceae archaeon]
MEILDASLVGEDGKEIKLKDLLKGKWTVLYVYPKDNTPGCTAEAKEFSEILSKFVELNVQVYGISMDSPSSHKKFKKKHGLNVPLLTDRDGSVIRKLGAWGKKSSEKEGIIRSTFIFDQEGKLVWRKIGVKPRGHAAEILSIVREMISEKKQ